MRTIVLSRAVLTTDDCRLRSMTTISLHVSLQMIFGKLLVDQRCISQVLSVSSKYTPSLGRVHPLSPSRASG